jgi:hypothetical protein
MRTPDIRLPRPPLSPLQKDFLHLLFLFFVCCLAYWPLAFHVFSLKNDALNYFLPVRFQVSEAISHHRYPFWSPYFNLGYPLHGDMQSGVWNPVVQFLSLFGPYTLNTLEWETLFYVFLSGAGMYFLLKRLQFNGFACLSASTAYMLCGFNSDSCQYLNWICSAAFLPFVILFYYRMLEEKGLLNSLFTGFFLYLLFVCAYPAHFIVTLYLLLAIFVYHQFLQRKKREIPFIRLLWTGLMRHLPALLCFLILSLPAILSYSSFLPLSERGGGATYAEAMSNSLHPFFLLAYWVPLAIYRAPFGDITDPLERNSYFGVILFVFSLSAYFIRTGDPRIRFVRVAVLVFQLFSLGRFGVLRPLSYYILPLMNTFRHPACLKLFTVFFCCILSSWCLDLYSSPKPIGSSPEGTDRFPEATAKAIKKASLFCGLVLALFFLVSLPAVPGLLQKVRSLYGIWRLDGLVAGAAGIRKITGELSFREMLLFDSTVQLLFMTALLSYAIPKRSYLSMILLCTANSLLHVLLFTPFTVVKKDTAAKIQQILDKTVVDGYPIPSLELSMRQNSSLDSSRFDDIGCSNLYNKRIGRNGYRITPSNLLSQNQFWSDAPVREIVWQYPVLYRPDTVLSTNGFSGADPRAVAGRKIAFIGDSLTRETINRYQPSARGQLSITGFEPGHFNFTSSLSQKAFYVLLQNDYPLWKLKIDGMDNPIIRSDISFMGMEVPAGVHKIEFIYSPEKLVLALWLSTLLTGLLLLLLFIRYLVPGRHPPC